MAQMILEACKVIAVIMLLTGMLLYAWLLFKAFFLGHVATRQIRWLILGVDQTGTLLVVSHTYWEETETSATIRLISARKATKNETKQYTRK